MIQRINRALLALEAPHRLIVVNRNDQAVAQTSRLLQISDMAGMQDVKTTVGHYHAFIVCPGILHGEQ